MNNAVNLLSKEVKEKLIALDHHTSIIWDLSCDDPEYRKHHDICKALQEELISKHGLTPNLINKFTYGEGGVLNG